MGISDVLADGVAEIVGYLDDEPILAPDYVPSDYVRATATAVAAMERVRWSPGFDLPPDFPAPEPPADDWELFKQTVAWHRDNRGRLSS